MTRRVLDTCLEDVTWCHKHLAESNHWVLIISLLIIFRNLFLINVSNFGFRHGKLWERYSEKQLRRFTKSSLTFLFLKCTLNYVMSGKSTLIFLTLSLGHCGQYFNQKICEVHYLVSF